MVKFESSIGGKSAPSPQLRQFDVPDETGEEINYRRPPRVSPTPQQYQEQFYLPPQQEINRFQKISEDAELEAQIRAAKEARRTGKERLSDGAKRRIEMLIGMTRLSRSVKIGETEFILQTLKTKDLRQAMFEVSKYDETVEFPYEMRKQLLGRSLFKVGGLEVEQFLGTEDLEARLSFVDEIEEAVLARLYDEYLILDKESKDKFSIKNIEQKKELESDLKK